MLLFFIYSLDCACISADNIASSQENQAGISRDTLHRPPENATYDGVPCEAAVSVETIVVRTWTGVTDLRPQRVGNLAVRPGPSATLLRCGHAK